MQNNDMVIKELMEKIEAQKTSLGNKPRSVLVTNGLFKKDAETFFNINTIQEYGKMAEALAFLMMQEDYYSKACAKLGIPNDKFKWNGYTCDEWEEDFRLRKDIIEYNQKKTKLDDAVAKLKNLMSEDARTASALENIKQTLCI